MTFITGALAGLFVGAFTMYWACVWTVRSIAAKRNLAIAELLDATKHDS